jgi:hypothetical protein
MRLPGMAHGHIEDKRIILITGIRGMITGGREELLASMDGLRRSMMTLGQILRRDMVLKGHIQVLQGLVVRIIAFRRVAMNQLSMNGAVRSVDDGDQRHRRKEIENMIFLIQLENIQSI